VLVYFHLEDQRFLLPEFSRPMAVESLRMGGPAFAIEARPDEREALLARLGLERLDRLYAEGTITRHDETRLVRLEGRVEADVGQLCVVTLEPVQSRLAFEIERLFNLDPEHSASDLVLDAEGPDIEPLNGASTIDIGEIVAQELSLNLEAYPRAADADAALAELTGASEQSSPFAALAPLARRKG
jgi:uncharacterized metal-binding protein YceD (DUF177 family)